MNVWDEKCRTCGHPWKHHHSDGTGKAPCHSCSCPDFEGYRS